MQNIESMISAGRYDDAMAALDSAISASDVPEAAADSSQAKYLARLYFMRGKLNWRLGHHADAINDYSMASSLDPLSPAVTALAQANEINDFHAPDLYNP